MINETLSQAWIKWECRKGAGPGAQQFLFVNAPKTVFKKVK